MRLFGEKPGEGSYICTKCGQIIVIEDENDTLPSCPKCDGTEYI